MRHLTRIVIAGLLLNTVPALLTSVSAEPPDSVSALPPDSPDAAKPIYIGTYVILNDSAPSVPDNQLEPFRVYTVSKNEDGWLHIVCGPIEKRVNVDQVIPFDQAIAFYSDKIRINPNASTAYINRANIWGAQGKFEESLKDYNEAIRSDPTFAAAYTGRGAIWNTLRDFERAIADHSEAIRLESEYTLAYVNRAGSRYENEDYDGAIADLDQAIQIDSNDAKTFSRRGLAWNAKKAFNKALADYSMAVELDPESPDGLNNLAWLLAACRDSRYRDGKKAVETATRACELTEWKSAECVDTLAAAYAEHGEFDKAAESETQAIALMANPAVKADFEKRLSLFQAKTAYHDE